jgi:hypothetical protein
MLSTVALVPASHRRQHRVLCRTLRRLLWRASKVGVDGLANEHSLLHPPAVHSSCLLSAPKQPGSLSPLSAAQSRLRTKKGLAVVRSSLHGGKTLCLHTRVLDRPRRRLRRLLQVTYGHTYPLEAICTHLFLDSSWRCGATAESQRDSTCLADPAAYGIVEKSTIAETMAGGFWWAYPSLQKWTSEL